MKKRFMLSKVFVYAVLFSLLSICSLKAQMTTVSSTGIVDSDSTIWAKATLTFTFLPNPNYPNVKPSPITYTTTAASNGTFTLAVPDNNYVAVGSTYVVTVCSQTSAPCSVLNPINITGATQDLTTYINSGITAPRFAANWYGAYGYADVEVTPTPLAGQTYYNVITPVLRQWNGSAWSSAGGGAVFSVFGRTGAVVAASGDYSSFYCLLTGCAITGATTIQDANSASAHTMLTVGNTGSAPTNFQIITAPSTNQIYLFASNQYGNGYILSTNPSYGGGSANYMDFIGISYGGGVPDNSNSGGMFYSTGASNLSIVGGTSLTPTPVNITPYAGSTLKPIIVTPPIYTVSGLPSASTAGAGAQVQVSDATTFTPGTCTGGGSDYMLAISNGTTWSCH